jgi:hypothetical protein
VRSVIGFDLVRRKFRRLDQIFLDPTDDEDERSTLLLQDDGTNQHDGSYYSIDA